MIEDHIVCPYQKTEEFSFSSCFRCKKYDDHIGAKSQTAKCRAQKTWQHKKGFEAAFMLNRLGYPFKVVIDAEEEGKCHE